MTELITSDSEFTEQQKNVLRFLANMMIPAKGSLPSASDVEIFPGILERLGENMSVAEEITQVILAASDQMFGAVFESLSESAGESVINEFRKSQPELVKFIQICVVSCYYKDPRVMTSLGVKAAAPHPGGYEVESSDWSLLEPVREMDKIYRKV